MHTAHGIMYSIGYPELQQLVVGVNSSNQFTTNLYDELQDSSIHSTDKIFELGELGVFWYQLPDAKSVVRNLTETNCFMGIG